MNRAVFTSRAIAAAVILIAVAFAAGSSAQGGAPAAQSQPAAAGPAPRTADGHPDLSGVWWPGRDLQIRPLGDPPPAAPGAPPPLAAQVGRRGDPRSPICISRGRRRRPRRSPTRTTRRFAACPRHSAL